MIDRSAPRAPRVHPAWCRCRICEPARPSTPRLSRADRVAIQCLLGLAAGLALAELLEVLCGGPGILTTLFGW